MFGFSSWFLLVLVLFSEAGQRVGKQVPFGKLRAGSHRAYRPIRNDSDILFSAPRRFYEMLLKSPNVWVLVLGFPSLKFSETGRRGGQESRFPLASSGQALTGVPPDSE